MLSSEMCHLVDLLYNDVPEKRVAGIISVNIS
jgi:hypothetical protein